jgi:AraC-like DNA-binding protein
VSHDEVIHPLTLVSHRQSHISLPRYAISTPSSAAAPRGVHAGLAFAHAAGMRIRTFTRRLRHETAMRPHTWLLTQRIDLSRRLLETTDLPVEAIAHRSGFGTATAMRQHFRRLLGVSPSTYRRTFTPTLMPRPSRPDRATQ